MSGGACEVLIGTVRSVADCVLVGTNEQSIGVGFHANKSPPAGLTGGRWEAGRLLGRQMVLQASALRLLGMGAERAIWEAHRKMVKPLRSNNRRGRGWGFANKLESRSSPDPLFSTYQETRF